jgi:hypothetical protein
MLQIVKKIKQNLLLKVNRVIYHANFKAGNFKDLGNTTIKVVFFVGDQENDKKKNDRRLIDTYVKIHKPAPEDTRPTYDKN